jgi:hypothetical protein
MELHNFTLNAISQAATFVGVCEGFLGNPANWDLWAHLFCTELHTLTTSEPKVLLSDTRTATPPMMWLRTWHSPSEC